MRWGIVSFCVLSESTEWGMTASEKMVSIFANVCWIYIYTSIYIYTYILYIYTSYHHVQPTHIYTPSSGEICICKGYLLFFCMLAQAKKIWLKMVVFVERWIHATSYLNDIQLISTWRAMYNNCRTDCICTRRVSCVMCERHVCLLEICSPSASWHRRGYLLCVTHGLSWSYPLELHEMTWRKWHGNKLKE